MCARESFTWELCARLASEWLAHRCHFFFVRYTIHNHINLFFVYLYFYIYFFISVSFICIISLNRKSPVAVSRTMSNQCTTLGRTAAQRQRERERKSQRNNNVHKTKVIIYSSSYQRIRITHSQITNKLNKFLSYISSFSTFRSESSRKICNKMLNSKSKRREEDDDDDEKREIWQRDAQRVKWIKEMNTRP